jgi:hypothetical protein
MFLKSAQKEGVLCLSSYISWGKIVYSRRGHCEHLKLFIAFAQPVVKNCKTLFLAKKVIFCENFVVYITLTLQERI